MFLRLNIDIKHVTFSGYLVLAVSSGMEHPLQVLLKVTKMLTFELHTNEVNFQGVRLD